MTQNSKDHLYIKEDHWGDWLFFSRDDDNSGRSAVTSKKLIAQAFYCYSTQLLIKSAKVLGYNDDVKNILISMRNWLRRSMMNSLPKMVCWFLIHKPLMFWHYNSNYFLKNANIAVERLVNNIEDYGHLTTGFWGTPFLAMCCLIMEK